MTLPDRKPLRLKEYDYSSPGAYFITICTKEHRQILSAIAPVGDDAHIVPSDDIQNVLTDTGKICDKYIRSISQKYNGVTVDKYIIMPNHIHMLISLDGSMKASTPTIPDIIRSFKIMVTKETAHRIWQRSFYDHIIRSKKDYDEIWKYIDTNVIRWDKDCYNENS